MHQTVAWVVVASAIISLACCLVARPAVPWQGRQISAVSVAAMLLMAAAPDSEAAMLAAGAGMLLSAMAGTAGLRGTSAVGDCCHRALGALAMATSAFAGVGHGAVRSHHGGMGIDAMSMLAGVIVAALVIWTTVAHRPGRHQASRLLSVDAIAMTAAAVAMWAVHAL